MAIRKNKNSLGKSIQDVALESKQNFVAPKPLATNENVRAQIVEEAPKQKTLRKVCTIQKVNGFSFFTTGDDRDALDFIAFRNKIEKQNVVRAALNLFLQQYYRDGFGLDEKGLKLLEEYEKTIYEYV